jgi:hypothetical protein
VGLVPDYAESTLALVDSRVAAGQARTTKMGTVTYRSPGLSDTVRGVYSATVVFDGSSGTAQPVKCFESVVADIGDRVGVVRYEGDWIITANYSLRTLGDGSYDGQFSPGGTTTSSTLVDMQGSPTAAAVKYRDATMLRCSLHFSSFSTVASTVVEFALQVTSNDGTVAYDEIIGRRSYNEASSHRDFGGWSDTAAVVGGQGYTATARWRRVSGTGTLTTDGNDACYIRIQEVVL